MFLGSFAWSFVFVSLPFHIQCVSTTDAALIVLGASTQVFFFTAILPYILPGLGVDEAQTLEVGGMLIFVSGVAVALGALAVPRLGELFAERD